MRKFIFIVVGIISAGFAIYYLACSTIDMFKLMVPRSASKVRSVKQVMVYPMPPSQPVEIVPIQ